MTTRHLWIVATAAVVTVAVGVRLFLNFSHAFPPGVNAAYYPLQARSWLEHGRLMYDDLPLIFWIDALLGRAIALTGRPLDDALLLATRLRDGIVEPFAAVPVMAFAYAWSGGKVRALPGAVAAGMAVVLSPPVMRMLSDFEKNSVGLLLMCATLWTSRRALLGSGARAWYVTGALLILLAMTHVGAFAVTVLLVAATVITWSALSFPPKLFAIAVASAAASVAALAGVLALFDPHRAQRLVHAPVALFVGTARDGLPVPGLVAVASLLGLVLYIVWRDRRDLANADIAIVAAAALTVAVIAIPKNYLYVDRLNLMAPVPASLLLAFLVARTPRAGIWIGSAALAVALLAATTVGDVVQRPLMNAAVAAELGQVAPQITSPDRTLVIAPHGFEWWAGYLLGTRVRSDIPLGGPRGYSRVLLLRNTVDCPPDIVSPFAAPEPPAGATKLFAGRFVEIYQLQ